MNPWWYSFPIFGAENCKNLKREKMPNPISHNQFAEISKQEIDLVSGGMQEQFMAKRAEAVIDYYRELWKDGFVMAFPRG